ncbi:MAG: hypothetical protein R3F14_48030 [Polyangiaceae bacterium]
MQNNPLLRAFVLASLETVHERLDAEVKAQAAAEAKAKKQAAARAKIEAKARAEAEASARARAEAEAEARAAAELMRQIEDELRARAEAERAAREAEARAQAEAGAKARADAEAAAAKAEGEREEKARAEAESDAQTGAAVTIPWSPSAFAQGLGHPHSSVDELEIETWNFGGATDANASIEADAGSDINATVVAPALRTPPPRTPEPDEAPPSVEATEPAESPTPSVEAPRPRFRTYVTPRGSLKARASNEPPVFTALRTWLLSDTARKRRADAKKSLRTFTPPPTPTGTPHEPSPKLPPLRAGEGLRTIIRRVVSEEVGELSRAVAERVPFEASDSPRSSPGLETVEQYIQRTGHAPGNAEPAGVASQPAEFDSPPTERESPAAAEMEPPALRDVVLPRPPEEIFPLDFCAADGSHIHDPEWDDDMEPPPTEDDIVIDDGDPDDDPDPELLVSAGRWNNQ